MLRPVPGPSVASLASPRALRAAVVATVAFGLAACVDLAPEYARPDAPVAATWNARGGALPAAAASAATAVAVPWDRFIADPRLREVVGVALANNRDLRAAVLNVERARALYRIQDAARRPSVQGSVSAARTRSDGLTANGYAASVGVGYELDLFGRIRNLDDAALAAYFSTREARRAAQVLLVSEVATAWLSLAADGQRLALSRQTLDSQRRSLELAIKLRDLGASTGLAVAQVRSTVEAARIQVAAIETQIGLDRNALELLLGAALDDRLAPDARLPVDASALFDVPRDLPSSILAERPDVKAAEYDLKAAYAGIGAARAAYFPRVTLTGSAGVASAELRQLVRGGSAVFGIGPSISVPIFDGGVNDANLAIARVDRDAAIAAYERSVQGAFREVADVLVARGTLAERTAGQHALVEALDTSFRLSDAVFRQGGTSYLQVLEAQRSLYGAQQGLIDLALEEQTSRVALYKALGGGWSDDEAAR